MLTVGRCSLAQHPPTVRTIASQSASSGGSRRNRIPLGERTARYGVDDTIRRIENKLVRYTYQEDVAVISPTQAYEKVKNGAFRYADALRSHSGDSVSVISCTMDYEIDTKGFYQPVYLFEILIPETGNTCLAMIPAIK